jgi:hypothetical protein
MNATGEPGESFKASVTPEAGSFGTMSFHTAWENTEPIPEPQESQPRKRPRPLRWLDYLIRNQEELGPIAAAVLLIFGFTVGGVFEFRRRQAATLPFTPTLSERRDTGPPTGHRPQPAEAVLATTTTEDREALLQAARKKLPPFGGKETPVVLDAALRAELESFLRPILPKEPPARPGDGDRSVSQSSSQLASSERMGPR